MNPLAGNSTKTHADLVQENDVPPKKQTPIVIIGDAARRLAVPLSKYSKFNVQLLDGARPSFDVCIVAAWQEMPAQIPSCAVLVGIENPHTARGENGAGLLNEAVKKRVLEAGGVWVPAAAKFLRWGLTRMFDGSDVSEAGWKALARESERAVERGLLIAMPSTQRLVLRVDGGEIDLLNLINSQPELADKLTLEVIRKPTRIILANLPNSTQNYSAKSAISLINSEIDFGVGLWSPVSFTPPIQWSMEGPDRSWQSYLLGLDFLLPPLVWWSQNANPGIADSHVMLDKIASEIVAPCDLLNDHALVQNCITVIFDFIDNNPRVNPVLARAWHEGTTSRRLRTLLLAMGVLTELDLNFIDIPPGSVAKIMVSIADHVDVLSHDLNYRPTGNHGFRQDLLLYISSLLFSKLPSAEQWGKLARSRLLEQQLAKGVAADGSWCEHSTGYHRLTTNFVRKFCRIAQEAGDESFVRQLSGYYYRMARFQNKLLRADNTLPAIGDTGTNCQAVRLREEEFGIPEEIDEDDNTGNWFVVRGPRDFHAVFHADMRSAKHKHADDLSFTLFYQGRNWIVDPGALNRELGSKMRDHFCLDPAAHNTWSVNGAGYGFSRAGGVVGLDRHCSGNKWRSASGLNERYAGGTVRRTMIHIAGQPILVITDHVAALGNKTVNWASHLHFACDLMIKRCDGHYEARREGEDAFLHIQCFDQKDARHRLIRGQEHPLQGWVMSGWGQAEPADVLVRELDANKRTVVTVIKFVDVGEVAVPSVSTHIEKDVAAFSIVTESGTNLELQVIAETGIVSGK